MLEIYNSATICAYNEPLRCGLRLEPGEWFYKQMISKNILLIFLLFFIIIELNCIMLKKYILRSLL